jgi:multidrug efflux system membrane fusion protein
VIFAIPEDNVSVIAKRLHDGATLSVEAFDRTISAKIAEGKLTTLDNTIDVTTGTVKLRAQFSNEDNTLFPNQFVNISLRVNTLLNQVIMPSSAERRGAPNGIASTFVYVVNADATVSVRPVVLGVVSGERVAVTSGLKPGEVVVTEGADRLRDGATVLLPNAATSPALASPAAPQGKPAPGAQGPRRRGSGTGSGRPPPSS